MGVVHLEIGVILRNFDKYGIECWLCLKVSVNEEFYSERLILQL
jgi:hypothetical protein